LNVEYRGWRGRHATAITSYGGKEREYQQVEKLTLAKYDFITLYS
jgi:hypothetical protein